jgi:uncharacterized membrane protein
MNDANSASLERRCLVCGQASPPAILISGALVRESVAEHIVRAYPQWTPAAYICRTDLARFRSEYVHSVLATEKGELTSLEQEVVASMREHELLTSNVEQSFEQSWTFGERLADRIATFGGSWSFLIMFFSFLAGWIILNAVVLWKRPLDPYPFILLNLMLSCLAAMQAPIIMMSQNRQEAKDRVRSQHDYQINLKAELEIRHLHEKLDHLLSHQWEHLVQIQEVQLDLLEELSGDGEGPGGGPIDHVH